MKVYSGVLSVLILVMATPPHTTHAAFPYDQVVQYECDQATAQKDETGFACGLGDAPPMGTRMDIVVIKGFPDDPDKQRRVNYERAKLMTRYAEAGGLLIHLYNATAKPHTMQACSRKTALESFWCGKWEPVPQEE